MNKILPGTVTMYGQHTDLDSQAQPGTHGSGTHAGAGYGNKTSGSDEIGEHDTRFGSGPDTGAYSNATDYGSGTTGGAGSGNKLSSSSSNTKEGKGGKLLSC